LAVFATLPRKCAWDAFYLDVGRLREYRTRQRLITVTWIALR